MNNIDQVVNEIVDTAFDSIKPMLFRMFEQADEKARENENQRLIESGLVEFNPDRYMRGETENDNILFDSFLKDIRGMMNNAIFNAYIRAKAKESNFLINNKVYKIKDDIDIDLLCVNPCTECAKLTDSMVRACPEDNVCQKFSNWNLASRVRYMFPKKEDE